MNTDWRNFIASRFNLCSSSCPWAALIHCYAHVNIRGLVNSLMQFSVSDASKPLTFEAFIAHADHVFKGWSLRLLPVKIVFSTFLGHASGSMCFARSCQQRRKRLSMFSILNRLTLLLKGPLSRLRQFLTTESPSEMMKNVCKTCENLFLSLGCLTFCLAILFM